MQESEKSRSTNQKAALSFLHSKKPEHVQELHKIIEAEYTDFVNQYYIREKRLIRNYIHLQKERFFYADHVRPILLMDGDECVGGAIIVEHAPHSNISLPLEGKQLQIKEEFKHLDIAELKYAELYRFVLLKKYRNKDNINKLLQHIVDFSIKRHYEYLFIVATFKMTRFMKIIAANYDYNFNTIYQANLPKHDDYGYLNMYLTMVDLVNRKLAAVSRKSVFNPNQYNESEFFNNLRRKAQQSLATEYLDFTKSDQLIRRLMREKRLAIFNHHKSNS
mgnify:CR=1 FL=1